MAEVVFQHLEGMLPELEDMERMGVFSREELRLVNHLHLVFQIIYERIFSAEFIIVPYFPPTICYL